MVPYPFDPQSLNRYSYCRNNPLIYLDPTGHYSAEWGATFGDDTDRDGITDYDYFDNPEGVGNWQDDQGNIRDDYGNVVSGNEPQNQSIAEPEEPTDIGLHVPPLPERSITDVYRTISRYSDPKDRSQLTEEEKNRALGAAQLVGCAVCGYAAFQVGRVSKTTGKTLGTFALGLCISGGIQLSFGLKGPPMYEEAVIDVTKAVIKESHKQP